MKYKKQFITAFTILFFVCAISTLTTVQAQFSKSSLALVQSDADASTLTVCPNPINGELHYIQDVITGTGTYFSGHNSFLYCYDAFENYMVCYCTQPNRPTPTSDTLYTDYLVSDISTQEGINQTKALPILMYGYGANQSSCNSQLHGYYEMSQVGGTFGDYVINGDIKTGLLINGVFFEMSAGEAYALTAALIHKINGADVGEITGSVVENNYTNGENVRTAAAYLETLSEMSYAQGHAGGSLWFAADGLNKYESGSGSFQFQIKDPSKDWISMPKHNDSTDWSNYSIDGKITIKIIYQSKHMENKLIKSYQQGINGNISYSHDAMTTVSYDASQNGYYDYFTISENPNNTVSLQITYGGLTDEYFTTSTLPEYYSGTKFCQEATISFDYSQLTEGKILDLSVCTQTGVCHTPAYGDGDGDGTANLAVRNFQTADYQNIALSSPNSYLSISSQLQLSNSLGNILISKDSNNKNITMDNNNYSLKGATYCLYTSSSDAESSSNPYATATTDEKGNATFSDLPFQTYYIKEVKAPNGYSLDNTIYTAVINSESPSVKLNCPEPPNYFSIETLLLKQDTEKRPLANAEFTVKYYCEVTNTNPSDSGYIPKKTWILKSDKNGIVKLDSEHLLCGDDFYYDDSGFPCFPLGTITIEETAPPDGYYDNNVFVEKKYQKTSEVYIKTIDSQAISDIYSPPVFINEEFRQAFQIIKYGFNTEGEIIPLSGAGFMACPVSELLKDSEDKYIWDSSKIIPIAPDGSDELITDKNGYAKSCPLPHGTYLIKETTVPFNHIAVEDFIVTIEADSFTDLEPIEITNDWYHTPVTGQICINKTGETRIWNENISDFSNNYLPLKDVQFDIYAGSDIYSKEGDDTLIYAKDTYVCSIYTDENGYAETTDLLPLGEYIIKEHTPYGYQEIDNLSVSIKDTDTLTKITETTHTREVAIHTLNIKNQLIVPKIDSSALDCTTKTKYCEAGKSCYVVDTVTYENLIPGNTYTLKGYFINKSTGEYFKTANSTVTSSVKFTPTQSSGNVNVPFFFDSQGTDDTAIVIYQELYHKDELIASHKDINSQNQTIYIETPKEPQIPDSPRNPDIPNTPATSDSSNLQYIFILLIISLIGSSIFLYQFFSHKKHIKNKH